MKKCLLLAAVAGVATMSVPAAATITIDATSLASASVKNDPLESTISFSDSFLATPSFGEYLTFTNNTAAMYNFTLGTASPDVDFTSAFLTAGTRTTPLGATLETLDPVKVDGTELYDETDVLLDAGTYTLNINGNNRGTGSLSGTIYAANIQPGIPEPSTWAMMLIGFGAVGFGLRRRKGEGKTARVRIAYA